MPFTLPADHPAWKLNRIARRWGDEHFDEVAGLVAFSPAGDTQTDGTRTHALLESCYYAFALLDTGEEDDYYRAAAILERVLPRQDLDADSPRWAGFPDHGDPHQTPLMGLVFAYILSLDDEQRLFPAPLKKKLDAAFRLTVMATMRQDISPAKTSGALLSAALAAAGAALRQFDHAEDFAFTKFLQVYARGDATGTFDEYLSPTDYGTDLYALYSAARLAKSDRIQAVTRGLLRLLWDDIEFAYHPPTLQFSGPHSFTVGDDVLAYACTLKSYLFLATDGRYPINEAETRHAHDTAKLALVRTHAVARQIDPDTPRPANFQRAELPPLAGRTDRVLRRYQDERFSLGTISEQDAGGQRRNLLAYWRAETDGRLGVAKSTWQGLAGDAGLPRFYSAQSGRSVLVALRVPTASEPAPAFSHRLEFNLPGTVASHTDGVGEWTVKLPGMTVEVQPIPLPEVGHAPTLTTSGMVDHTGAWLSWQWKNPEMGQEFYEAAFVVSFTPAGAIPERVDDVTVGEEYGTLVLGAVVEGERVELQVPAASPRGRDASPLDV